MQVIAFLELDQMMVKTSPWGPPENDMVGFKWDKLFELDRKQFTVKHVRKLQAGMWMGEKVSTRHRVGCGGVPLGEVHLASVCRSKVALSEVWCALCLCRPVPSPGHRHASALRPLQRVPQPGGCGGVCACLCACMRNLLACVCRLWARSVCC